MSGLVLARYELRDNDWRLSLGNRIVLMRRIWAEMQKSSYRLRYVFVTIKCLGFWLIPGVYAIFPLQRDIAPVC